jgi:cytochrome c oxidase assembly protein subunit 15
MPSGPVTFTKAWIEMIHRYLAMTVGVLILVMAVTSWLGSRQGAPDAQGQRRSVLPHSPWWPTVTLVWVLIQGLFGKYTVTLKLYPAVVTAHLLGGMFLLALLMVQHETWRGRRLVLNSRQWGWAVVVTALLWVQIALGGWVSTNYAVLACDTYPLCQGNWLPEMNLNKAFELWRPLGQDASGQAIPFQALTAIHMVHRWHAVIPSLLILLVARAWMNNGLRTQGWLLKGKASNTSC